MLALLLLLSQTPLFTLRTQQAAQIQTDTIQDRLDGPNEKYMRAYIDGANFSYGNVVVVTGWNFACGENYGTRVSVIVNGSASVQTEPLVTFHRYSRPDISNSQTINLCAQIGSYVPIDYAGFDTLVDMSPYLNGYNNDGCYDFQLYLYNNAGKRQKSNLIHLCR